MDIFSVDPTVTAPVVKHVVKHAKHITNPVIHQGFSMLTIVISNVVSLLVGAGLGWYIKGRGWFGVKVDVDNVVQKVKNIEEIAKSA